MLNASRQHFDNARALEAKDQLDAALLEYRGPVELDPGNTQAADRVVQLEKIIRDRIEASRPKPAIVQLREQARQISAAPLLNPASRAPLDYNFKQASLRDILTFIGSATGINVIYDASFNDRPVTVTLQGSIEQVLNTLLSSNGLFYSVLDERTIVVAQDSAPNRLKDERQVALTIPLSYADVTELSAMLIAITRTTTGVTIPPVIIPNKAANTITVRATEPVVGGHPRAGTVERQAARRGHSGRRNSRGQPRARERARAESRRTTRLALFFLLRNYRPRRQSAIQPEHDHAGRQYRRFLPYRCRRPSWRFLATDTNTKVLAQTQLRGAEGPATDAQHRRTGNRI